MGDTPRYWFKAKRYGYGWYPATKEGWGVIAVWLVLLLLNLLRFQDSLFTDNDSIEVAIESALLTSILVYVSYKKGEPARWRWGGDDNAKNV